MEFKGNWKVISVLLVLGVLLISTACAGTSTGAESRSMHSGSSWDQRMQNVPELVFRYCKQGLGYGSCPVYTAPSENAFRTANGRACVATDLEMWEGGYDSSGWLLVYYEANDGSFNAGYIPPNYIQGFQSRMPVNLFDSVPMIAKKKIQITNNPMQGRSYFAVLNPGEEFFVIGKYDACGNWWYIECTVDGKQTRGFIERNSSAFSLACQDSGYTPIVIMNCYDIGGNWLAGYQIAVPESRYISPPYLEGYQSVNDPIYITVNSGICCPSQISWTYTSNSAPIPEVRPLEDLISYSNSGNGSVVFPIEWDTCYMFQIFSSGSEHRAKKCL